MPIRVQTVRIAGFRGIANLELNLGQHAVFIGANNSGKTSALKAVQLALGDSRFIVEEDFHVTSIGEVANRIVVDVRILPTDDQGAIAPQFDRAWTNEFRNFITPEEAATPQSSLKFRVKIERTHDERRYYPERRLIKSWPVFAEWLNDKHVETTAFPGASLAEVAPFYFQDAQRDIMEDAKFRGSYLGRVLAKVSYRPGDLEALQGLIDGLNKEAVDKSDVLKSLQNHLQALGNAVANGGRAELSPVAKSVRDLK